MTFKDVTFRNIKGNFKKYLSYYLCTSFSIMVFFMYSTLLYNKAFIETSVMEMIKGTMLATLAALVLFSIFFINYAHTSFIRSRGREFGLYLTLGMTGKDIGRLLGLENFIIAAFSLILGLLSGTVFSRLFFMLVNSIMGLRGIAFHLDYKSYVLTAGIFIVIFSIITSLSRLSTRRLEISELLKESRIARQSRFYHPVFGILGIVMLALSFPMLDYSLKGRITSSPLLSPYAAVILCVSGLYVTISQFGHLLPVLFKSSSRLYYRNLLNVSEMKHRFARNRKILFVLSILSGVTVYFMGFTYSYYSQVERTAVAEQPYHLMLFEKSTAVKIGEDRLETILNSSKNKLVSERSLDYMTLTLLKTSDGVVRPWGDVLVLSESQYGDFSGKAAEVHSGEAYSLVQITKPETNQWFTESKLILKQKAAEYEFAFKKELYGVILNQDAFIAPRFTVILDDEDYARLRINAGPDNRGTARMFNFMDWEKTGPVFERLEKEMKQLNPVETDYDNRVYAVSSRLKVYETTRQLSSFFLSMWGFIGLLFFAASGTVLYFKLFTELEDEKARYGKLFRLGITDVEMKKVLSRQLVTLFFIPLLLGSTIGYLFLMVTTINLPWHSSLLQNSLVVIAVYFVFQTVYYLITRRKHLQEVIGI